MNTLQECPEDVRTRGSILYSNGFLGFQEPARTGSDKDRFIVCWPHTDNIEQRIQTLREATGCASLLLGDWIGRDYISIHWTDHARIPSILTTFLQHGIDFQTQTRGMQSFHASVDKLFTYEALEKKVIEQTRQLQDIRLISMIHWCIFKEWNYITEEGRLFVRELRLRHPCRCDDGGYENHFEWDIFKNYDPSTLLSIEVTQDEKKQLNDVSQSVDSTVCCVCMEREPNTMVLPCEHVVVCNACSLTLEKTSNAHVCVLCRQEIKHKLY